jgi:hypothetical protein
VDTSFIVNKAAKKNVELQETLVKIEAKIVELEVVVQKKPSN